MSCFRWPVCGLAWLCCTWSMQARADGPVITISDPSPADESTLGSLNPTLSVAVHHSAGIAMNIAVSSDASGRWEEIGRFADAASGTFKVRPTNMLRRGETYRWTVTATDGTVSQSKTFGFTLATFIGPKQTVIAHSDCWKYGYIKHGWEKGRWFATTQRGVWASYDLDKGWCRTFQRLVRREKWDGGTAFGDGGDFGHPFWGYWDGRYHALGLCRASGGLGFESVASRTFEAFRNSTFETDVRDTGTRTQHASWQEGTTYTFGESRAWIMAIDYDEPAKQGVVKYWEWTKEAGWKQPAVVGTVSNHTGRVALVRQTRDTWYLFVTEGKHGTLDGLQNTNFQSTLKYFKSTDAGKTWGKLTDTGIPAHALWSSVSFARYGENYYVFLSAGYDSYAYFTRDLEKWTADNYQKSKVAKGMWMKPHGTLLHQSALIFTVAGDLDFHDDQYGIIVVVPEMVAGCQPPVQPAPADGATLPKGTTETALAVKVHGPQTCDVAFYWADGTFIGEDKLLREGDTAAVAAKGLEPGRPYRWYAVARGALLECYGGEPDCASDGKWSEVVGLSLAKGRGLPPGEYDATLFDGQTMLSQTRAGAVSIKRISGTASLGSHRPLSA